MLLDQNSTYTFLQALSRRQDRQLAVNWRARGRLAARSGGDGVRTAQDRQGALSPRLYPHSPTPDRQHRHSHRRHPALPGENQSGRQLAHLPVYARHKSQFIHPDTSVSLLENLLQPAFSLYFFVQSLTFVSAGFGVYTVLASFHKQSETTTEQLTPRWKIALAAPWVAIGAILLNVLLISLVQFKVTRYASEIASMDFFNQCILILWCCNFMLKSQILVFEEDLFLALPSVAALLGAGQLWCVLFYLGLFLLCLGTAVRLRRTMLFERD